MQLLVLGASGQVGKHVVQQALARGHGITAIVRPSTPFEAPVGLIRAEVTAEGVLANAVPGHDAVICCLGQKRRSLNPWSQLLSPSDLCETTARRLVAAMTASGVRKIVALSSAGVGDSGPRMNAAMRFVVAASNVGVGYRDLEQMERIFANSDLDWCCLRPVTLVNGPLTGNVREVDAFGLTMTISRADVADELLQRVEHPTRGRTPQVAGNR
jgi:putative NADH-flavin reductase